MRRILIAFLGAVLLCSASFAADSKEFIFAGDLIGTLNGCQFFLEAPLEINAESSEMMSAEMKANSQLEQIKLLMQKYLRDKDENMKSLAIDVVVGIDNLIDSNLKFIELARKYAGASQEGIEGSEVVLRKIAEQRDKAWGLILGSAIALPSVIAESSNRDFPTGPIPFKISEEERRVLRDRMNQAFKDKLKNFDIAREQKKQGKEYDPRDISEFVFSVALIYDELSSRTYEEFRLKAYRYKYGF